ncbi:MAG TPA: ferric reductase-like transmembrane domain-containing protein [Acidimicrobiales bacterium]
MTTDPKLWWYVARASGLTAWAVAGLSVVLGLALSGRTLGKNPTGPWLLDLHRFLGALAVVFTGVHIGGTVADSYVHFGLADVLVPLASGWRPGAVAWGVVGLYLLVAIEISSYLRKRLSKRVWHAVHLSSVPLYVVSTLHLFTAGHDASTRPVRLLAVLMTSTAVFFLTYRIAAGKPAAKRPPRTLPARSPTKSAA